MNYDEVVTYLYELPRFKTNPGVVREREILRRLGNPEAGLSIIHVAGTNGKGSVCAYLDGMLRGAGYLTGTFTSPHLVRVNERICVNGEEVSDEEFVRAFYQVDEVSRKMEEDGLESAAFFDYLTAMAMLIFSERRVDFVIMETGLGGRLDCTNAVKAPVLSVITSISLDHTEILGNTLEEIAREKAGIIKENVPVVFLSDEAVRQVFQKKAKEMGTLTVETKRSDICIVKRDAKGIDFLLNNKYYRNDTFSLSTVAEYQAVNGSIALTAIAVLEENGLVSLDMETKKKALYDTVWAGRMEQVVPGFYLDGAHNADGVDMFLQTVRDLSAKRRFLLFSAVREKDYDRMIRTICESALFDGYIVTALDKENHRALSLDAMEGSFHRWTDKQVYLASGVLEAIDLAKSLIRKGDVLFATGSLYLVGEIKAAI